MRINVEYDYYLTGKDVMLWVNLIGKQYKDNTTVRIGEARKITLRANGISANVASQSVPAGASEVYQFSIKINDTEEWYRHANFEAIIEASETVSINSTTYSDITDNVANVSVNVTNNSATDIGTVSVSDALISNEF